MSLPHNCAIQTSRGICHRRLWLQNQSAIVLQQIRSNHLLARGLQSGRNGREKRRGGSCWQVTSLSTGCPSARPSNLEWEHSRSAHTVASKRLRQGTQVELVAAGSASVTISWVLEGIGLDGYQVHRQKPTRCITTGAGLPGTLIPYEVASFFLLPSPQGRSLRVFSEGHDQGHLSVERAEVSV